MAFSATGLVAVFGDELDEVGSARLGMKMPGREVKVSTKDLAAAALAITVWDLVEQGQLGLRQETRKRLLGKSTVVVLEARSTGHGFAGQLLAAALGGIDMRTVVERMLGGESLDPASRLVAMAHAELAEIGVMAASGDGRVKSVLKAVTGTSPFEMAPGNEAALRPDWDTLLARWRAWSAANADAHRQLLATARSAIERATKRD